MGCYCPSRIDHKGLGRHGDRVCGGHSDTQTKNCNEFCISDRGSFVNGKGCVCKDQYGSISEDFPIYYGYCCENGELISLFSLSLLKFNLALIWFKTCNCVCLSVSRSLCVCVTVCLACIVHCIPVAIYL